MDKKAVSTEEIREEKLSYFKNWRLKNKDKIKQHNQTYWKRRAEKKLLEGEVNE